jgi:hypothetical protein
VKPAAFPTRVLSSFCGGLKCTHEKLQRPNLRFFWMCQSSGRLRIDRCTIRTISTVMRFDTAVDVTASELRVELMFPADHHSEAYFRKVTNTARP